MSKTQTAVPTSSDDFSWSDEFIQQECNCCLCGHELEFEHVFDFLEQKVTETSSCPKCKIEMKTQKHCLH